jgi:hypothetical protein
MVVERGTKGSDELGLVVDGALLVGAALALWRGGA